MVETLRQELAVTQERLAEAEVRATTAEGRTTAAETRADGLATELLGARTELAASKPVDGRENQRGAAPPKKRDKAAGGVVSRQSAR
jgi:hypothetical protein